MRTSGNRKLRSGCDPSIGKATQFERGRSGNPGGRPKQDAAALIAQGVFENNGESIYVAMLNALKRGNANVFSALADRAYGKPTIARSTTARCEAKPIQLKINYVRASKEAHP